MLMQFTFDCESPYNQRHIAKYVSLRMLTLVVLMTSFWEVLFALLNSLFSSVLNNNCSKSS